MRREFKLPDVGEGLTEAEIVRWHVRPGDPVKINQTIVEIETAKAVVELPCPFEGVVAALMADEGETVDVGRPIIAVDTSAGTGTSPGTSVGGGDAADAADGGPPAGTAAAPGHPTVPPAGTEAARSALADDMVPTPPDEGAVEPGLHGSPAPKPARQPVLVGYGVKLGAAKRRPRKAAAGRPVQPPMPGRATPGAGGASAPGAVGTAPEAAAAPVAAPGAGPAAGPAVPNGSPEPGTVRASGPTPGRIAVLVKPPVRKLAKDLGVDLAAVRGTGPSGSITREDVHAAAAAPQAAPAQIPGLAAAAPAREERIPVKGVRRATAQAMVASAFTAPHVTEFLQVDVTETMLAVGRLRAMADFAEVKVSPLLLVAKALLVAARRYPVINSSWDDSNQEIVVRHYVNLGIAAATPRGLLVPNIKDAHALSLPELARALNELAETARAGRTRPADMSGGTITITNVGVFGVDTGTPILNPGEAAILAFGQVRDLPWVVDGQIVPRKVCTLALSFDHRIVDGELGSKVLRDVGAMLEDPLRILAWS